MMITLNDLGRAAWDAEWLCMLGHGVKRPSYDQVSRNDQQMTNAGALAVVERFVAALDDDTDIAEALASLRAEAGAGAAEGSAT